MNDDNYQEDDSSTNGAPEANTDDQVYQEILTEIDKQQSKQKSWIKNILVLAISLYIFFQLGFFEGGLYSIVLLILVLLIHETGHLVGMRLFGYKNVQMFFIPFFGAAVSGESRNVATYKKAFISLLGPMPGIIIGCVLMFMYATTGRDDYLNTAGMFLIINCFNLLPFFPLDGGRFLYLVIFSRNRFLELCFKIFAALALMLVGYALGAWLLALLGLFGLLAVKIPFRLSKIAKHVRQSPAHIDLLSHPDNADPDRQKVPLPIAKVIIDSVYEYFPPPLEISTVALHTKEIWEKVCFRPTGAFSTIVLLVVYLLAFCLPPVALIGSMIVSLETRRGFVITETLEYQQPDGSTGLKEQVFFFGKLNVETEVDPNSYLYHGKEIYYSSLDANTVQAQGTWCRGKLDGPYNTYDEQGDLMRVTVYDDGNFVSRKVKVNGQWTEKKWEDLSFLIRWKIRRYNKRPRGPAKRQQ
ncbi:MAG: hypothetical protein ACYS32_10285 [Planctomycetota bacterium]|jgi:Zn-dependent protease